MRRTTKKNEEKLRKTHRKTMKNKGQQIKRKENGEKTKKSVATAKNNKDSQGTMKKTENNKIIIIGLAQQCFVTE